MLQANQTTPYGHATPFYGCYNRKDFKDGYPAGNGMSESYYSDDVMEDSPVQVRLVTWVKDTSSRDCNYKDTALGQKDPRCGLGEDACSRKTKKKAEDKVEA